MHMGRALNFRPETPLFDSRKNNFNLFLYGKTQSWDFFLMPKIEKSSLVLNYTPERWVPNELLNFVKNC